MTLLRPRAKALRAVGAPLLSIILNCALICGGLPERFQLSKTIFIPKASGSSAPGDFRPISISSTLSRCFHKVLANRLNKSLCLEPEQRGFIKEDGINENIFLLDLILNRARAKVKETHLATLDLVKAFDSVNHEAIVRALGAWGADKFFVDYISDIYSKSKTVFILPESTSQPFHPTCGVRQGDPLSPLLFNLVIDGLIRKIKDSPVGIRVDGLNIGISAYADDIILFAETRQGLQHSLDQASLLLKSCNLVISAPKSFSISIAADGKNQRTKIVDGNFMVDRNPLRSIKINDKFKYLGVEFSSEGILAANPAKEVEGLVSKIKNSRLKPNQKLYALRVHVLPKLYHAGILARSTIGMLKRADVAIRHFVRKILYLPKDSPNAFIHTSTSEGGLGIPSLRTLFPEMRAKRLEKLKKNMPTSVLDGDGGDFLMANIRRATDNAVGTKSSIFWSNQLDASVDGAALKSSYKVATQNRWVEQPLGPLVGRDFVNAVKLKINALPTLSRLKRGRPGDRLCRAGCHRKETLNHVLQNCHRTHGKRIHRHDHMVKFLRAHLEGRRFTVHTEPIFDTPCGKRKPDVVAIKEKLAYVIDAQVVGDSVCLKGADRRKIKYYAENETLVQKIKDLYKVDSVEVLSLTLNWRGVWSPQSAKSLLERKLIPGSMLSSISARVLIGGISCFNYFNRSTSRR